MKLFLVFVIVRSGWAKVPKGDFAIFPGAGEDGVGRRAGHELFELHGGGVDEPHRDSMVDGVRQE